MPIELGSAYGKIIIDASGVKKGTGDAKKEVGDFQKTFANAGKAIATTTGLIAGEIAILKKIFDFGREGAVVVQTKESFDRLLGSLGAAPDLLDEMQAASGMTVSQMKLMSATTTLLAGTSQELGQELADNAIKILEIAKAANKLNPSLGSTEFLYQSLMTGIKRGSPMIIDNTGITLKLSEAYEGLAAKLGKSVEELTSEEQKMAILNATVEAGDRIIQQVGGTTDSATDNFDRMTAAIIDQAEKIKAFWLPPLQDAADSVYYLLTWEDQLGKVLVKHEADLRKTGMSWEEYIKELGRAGAASRLFTQGEGDAGVAMALNTGKVNDLRAYYKLAGVEIDILTEEQYKWIAAVANGTVAVQTYGDGLVDAKTKTGAFADALPELTMNMEELELFMAGPLGEEMDNFAQREKDLYLEAGKIQDEIDELSGKKWLTAAQKEQLAENKLKLEEIQAQIRLNADEHELATKRILFDLLQQQLAMDGLTTEEGNALAVVAEKWGLVDEKTAEAYRKIQDYVQQVRDGKLTVDGLAQALDGIVSKEITITTHLVTLQEGNAGSQWSSGGKTYLGYTDDGETKRGGGKALGGLANPGRMYLVGEQGPELLVPNSTSTVIPNNQLRSLLTEDRQADDGSPAARGDTILQFYVQANGASDEDLEAVAWRTSELVMAKLAMRP